MEIDDSTAATIERELFRQLAPLIRQTRDRFAGLVRQKNAIRRDLNRMRRVETCEALGAVEALKDRLAETVSRMADIKADLSCMAWMHSPRVTSAGHDTSPYARTDTGV